MERKDQPVDVVRTEKVIHVTISFRRRWSQQGKGDTRLELKVPS